ncbi:cytosol aminopeptidase family, catalytic domain-containing protein [Chytriomyces sp. MP71]|nr:cytosol aminopeptidase family, catalytic domain-containing protein [Chytriomyces sp. MP71]
MGCAEGNQAAAGINAIRALNKEESFRVAVQPFNNNAKAAAEGAVLTAYTYNENKKIKMGEISTILYAPGAGVTLVDDWLEGVIGASAQNTARHLMETPANLLTPHLFSQRVTSLLASLPNTTVTVRDMAWIEAERMGMFLSVARGSAEEPRFLEIRYSGGESNSTAAAATPIALVGKGVTFDSGGISIKPSNGMADMKGDMGGAAVVVGIMEAIAKLRLRVNIVACIPLTENMPSGTATKPGDVVVARNGKTVEVDNTDAEGRLILGDAIHYACTTFHPKTVIELSTLTGAVDVALGYPYAGVFTTSDELWSRLENASKSAGEGFWRMPMDVDAYKPQIKSNVADLKNVGGRSAGSCTAAVFLQEFVEGGVEFAHIGDNNLFSDIAGVMKQTGSHGILARGMTGRPVRAIIEYIKEASK